MDVSIIIIAFNVRDEVLECLGSVEQHAGALTVETILVDNGSNDGTTATVARCFPDTKIVPLQANEGVAARNHGLRRARGRYRMFLDSDAVLTSGALEELVRFMDDRPEAGLVGPRLIYPDGALQLSTRRYPRVLLPFMRRPPLSFLLDDSAPVRRHLMADDPYDKTREVEYVIGACQLFTSAAQAAAGQIDPRILFGPDDADWCFSIRSAGLKVLYHPEATVIHDYRRSTAQRLSRMSWHHFAAFYRFQWKWRHDRRRLIDEGRAMDARARAAGDSPLRGSSSVRPHSQLDPA